MNFIVTYGDAVSNVNIAVEDAWSWLELSDSYGCCIQPF